MLDKEEEEIKKLPYGFLKEMQLLIPLTDKVGRARLRKLALRLLNDYPNQIFNNYEEAEQFCIQQSLNHAFILPEFELAENEENPIFKVFYFDDECNLQKSKGKKINLAYVLEELEEIETVNAPNTEYNQPIKSYIKTWSAILDNKTCPRCIALNGQQVRYGQSFEVFYGGKQYRPQTPPLHRHCRCSIVIQYDKSIQGLATQALKTAFRAALDELK